MSKLFKVECVKSESSTPVRKSGSKALTLLISVSRKKSHKTNRQAFFSRLMTKLAGERGNKISDLLVEQKIDEFKKEMTAVIDEIAGAADKTKPKVE